MRRSKHFKSILSIAILIVALSILWSIGYIQVACIAIYESLVPVEIPSRPAGVPAQAEWFGGRDGGVWIEFRPIEDSDSCFECHFYAAVTGAEHIADDWSRGVFCLDSGTADINLVKSICTGYDGTVVYLKDSRVLTPDLSQFWERFAMIEAGMSEDEVKSLLGASYYIDKSDSAWTIWIYDIPARGLESPKIYIENSTGLVEKVD